MPTTTPYAWFVDHVTPGGTHLAEIGTTTAPGVTPVCDPGRRFLPLNPLPLDLCYYDWQPCPTCHDLLTHRHLAVSA